MKRYTMRAPAYDSTTSGIVAVPEEAGQWSLADEAVPIEAERDQLKAENRQLIERVAELRAEAEVERIEMLEAEVERLQTAVTEPCSQCGYPFHHCTCDVSPGTIRLHVAANQSTLDKETMNLLMSAACTIERLQPPKTAQVRPGWKLPDAPTCPVCSQPQKPVAVNLGTGWAMEWTDWCVSCQTRLDDADDEIEWPFVGTHATAADFVALGFQVERP